MSIPAYVLAGGRSRRFGSDKARALIDGTPMLSRIADALAQRGHAVTVVARRPDAYADLGLRTLADRIPGRGPMEGLLAALADRENEGWLALLSCDWAAMDPCWLKTLETHATPPRSAVAFHDGRWQPLLALYHTRLREAVRGRLQSGARSVRGLLDEVGACAVPPPPGWEEACSVNTRPALARFLKTRATGGSPWA